MSRESLPMLDPASLESPRRPASVHGVVLAAGTSSRYGTANKLLETVDGEPLIRRAVAPLLEAGLTGVTVVLGHEADRVRDALEELADDVECRYNEAYADGQSASVRVGIGACRDAGADAALFALGDMPAVSSETIETLLEVYERSGRSVLAAGYDGERGNPVLFDAVHFDALGGVAGDIGGREILRDAADAAVVETGDPGVRRDVDRPDDLDEVSDAGDDTDAFDRQ